MMTLPRLRVWANGVTEWVVAYTAEHAAILLQANAEQCGISGEELDLDFKPVPDDRILTFDMDGTKSALTASEWATKNGEGFLATTEY